MFFSVMSLGYARSSEQEAKVLDDAVSGIARKLQPNDRFWDRLGKLVWMPFHAVGAAASAVFTTMLLPFQFVQHTLTRIQYTYDAAQKGIQVGVTWVSTTATTIASSVSSGGESVRGAWWGSITFVTTNARRIASLFGTLWTWMGGSVESLNAWWSTISEKFGRDYQPLSREASTRAWVAMDSAVWYLKWFHSYVVAFAELVVGRDHTSKT